MVNLTADRALIFRIIHRDNLASIAANGVHCKRSTITNPAYVNIGNVDLISKRSSHAVPSAPWGTLSDYVPFYFTPFSPMLLNIKTGYAGIQKRPNDEILILVSSIHDLIAAGIKFLFTDRHAYLRTAQFYSSVNDLDKIDWELLQSKKFKRNPDDPGRFERYQAEALVYKSISCSDLKGVVCFNTVVKAAVEGIFGSSAPQLQVIARPAWYF